MPWAKTPCPRNQILLFATTIDDRLAAEDPVRLFHAILEKLDWRPWEQRYGQLRGQPPIHPSVIASVILYGMTCGIRSSRRLEEACLRRVDFIWLAQQHTPDHSTFCDFRTRFTQQLKALYRQILHVALRMELVSLNQVMLDGTKVLANSSRHATASAKTIEKRLAELTAEIERQFAAAEAADAQEDGLFGRHGSPNRLPRKLAQGKDRQERLAKALEAARLKEQQEAQVAKVSLADPEAAIAPSKEGGFAPNYTPVVLTDGQAGLIVAADVLEGHDESQATLAAVAAVQENLGQKPRQLLADSAFTSGANLAGLAQQGVEAFIPSAGRTDSPDNPARRERPQWPVPPEQWDKLPLDRSTGRLGKTAFVFDAAKDCYWCPQGQALAYRGQRHKQRRKECIEYRHYECRQCAGCPLAQRCLTKKARWRSLDRDQHEPLREAMDARLREPAGQQTYRRRAPLVEGAIGIIKSVLGVRQFLLRGLEKTRSEWLWVVTAFNLRKLMAHSRLPAAQG